MFGDRKPFPFLNTEFTETQARFSLDVRWVAYLSNESGKNEVYVSSFPAPGGKVLVSTNGGVQPRWRRDGKELFYVTPDRKLMAVSVKEGSATEFGAPKFLFEVGFSPSNVDAGNPYPFISTTWRRMASDFSQHAPRKGQRAYHRRPQLDGGVEEVGKVNKPLQTRLQQPRGRRTSRSARLVRPKSSACSESWPGYRP